MIPAAAVAAAVQAIFESNGFKHPTDSMRAIEEARARVMLEAAAPHIQSANPDAGPRCPECYIDDNPACPTSKESIDQ